MYQALAALGGAVVTVAACYALGVLLIDRLLFINLLRFRLYRSERFPLGFVLGAACLHLLMFAVLALKVVYWPVVVGLLFAAIGAAVWKGSWRSRGEAFAPLGMRPKIFWGVLFGAFTVLAFFHAWAPESSSDGAGYHLGLVARYFRVHGFERITTNMFASLGGGVETLFLPAFIIGHHSAGALVHFSFAVALALAMFAYGRRIGKPWVGAAAALLTYASPVAGIDASSAYNDVAAAAIVFSVFYWLEIWDDVKNDLLLIPVGLLTGYAYAVKYTAFAILFFALGFVAWRSRKWKPVLLTAACSIPMIAPWMIKNWIYVQNPVAPFANTIFRNPNIHISFEREIGETLRRYNLPNKWTLPLEVTVRGDKTGGIIGPIFLAAPLALLALRQQVGRRLLAAGAVLFATYFFNIGTRFLIPCLPFLSLAMLLPIGDSPPLLIGIMLFHSITSWPAFIPAYDSLPVWILDRIPYREALRMVPQDVALRRASDAYSVAQIIEANVPKGERVLTSSNIPIAYTSREILVNYLAAFNEVLQDILSAGWSEGLQPTVRHTFRFSPITTRRVRLVDVAPVVRNGTAGQWGVHELRFYSHGVELQRQPEWRLRAWPNPWDVQLAFDNSPATRWRTWEPARPGMYLEVDFSMPQAIDEVRVETCPEDGRIRVAVQVGDETGHWKQVGGDPSEDAVKLHANIRRAATYELHARGVNYLLMSDTDYGADDIREDPESWGLEQIAAGFGTRLYKVVW
jgi:hypothetical protein